MITVASLEVGDLIAWVYPNGSPPVQVGVVLRKSTAAELEAHAGSQAGAAGVWAGWSNANVLIWDLPQDAVTPSPFLVLSVVKSHKVAADDLGPFAGLPE
jgi:hypothetical protein